MLDLYLKKDIDKISHEILKQSGAYDIFPTPIDKIMQYSELNIAKDINLSNLSPDILGLLSSTFKNVLDKIRGILDREKKLIYLDLNQSAFRQNFVKLHEVGHEVLSWQKETLKYLDDDATLDIDVREAFEAEANYFASATLFQQERFLHEMNKLPLGMQTSFQLSKNFGASIHATLRRYIEYTTSRCALLILENFTKNGFAPTCEVRNYFQSANFTKSFGLLNWCSKLDSNCPFVQDYYFKRRYKQDGIITILNKNGSSKFQYHFFNNTYNCFILIFPKGETKKSRIEIIVNE
jgi:Zn-dependent peptidase ImmA (M78 family)